MLDWKLCVAPVLSQYMLRMMQHGFPEKYRVDTLTRALRIYDHMISENNDGTRPLYRPKDWNVVARRLEKQKKKYNWSTKGGHIAPIFVPPPQTVSLPKHWRLLLTVKLRLVSTLKSWRLGALAWNQYCRSQTLSGLLDVTILTASLVIMGGERGETVMAVGSTMSWSVSCARRGIEVFILESHLVTYTLEVRNTWQGTGRGRTPLSWSSTRTVSMRGSRLTSQPRSLLAPGTAWPGRSERLFWSGDAKWKF